MTVRITEERGRLVIDIRTRGPDGNGIRERRNAPDGIRTAAAAKRWAEARQASLASNGQPEPEREPAPLFRDFADRWMREYVKAEKLKPSTADTYERILRLHLTPVLGDTQIDGIGAIEIQRVKLRVANKADKTRACVLSVLVEVLKAAEAWDEILKAPKIELPAYAQPEMEFWDFADWERLMAGARSASPMHLVTVLLGGDAGLRAGEMVALEWGDVAGKHVVVQRAEWEGKVGKPKGGKVRRIPMTDRLRQALADARHLRTKRVLWSPHGKVTRTTVQSWTETAQRRAGLPESRNPHKLRHTFCSHLSMRGVPPRQIQDWAGHADLKTTQRYMHLSPTGMEHLIHLLEPAWEQVGSKGSENQR